MKLTVLDRTQSASTSTQRALVWVTLFAGLAAMRILGGWAALWIYLLHFGLSVVVTVAVYKDIERTGKKPKTRYALYAMQEVACLAMAYYGDTPWVGLVPWVMTIVNLLVDRMEGHQHSADTMLDVAVSERRAQIAHEEYIISTAAFLATQPRQVWEQHLIQMDAEDAQAVRDKLGVS